MKSILAASFMGGIFLFANAPAQGTDVWADVLLGAMNPGPAAGVRLNVDAFDGWTVSGEVLASNDLCIFCDAERLQETNFLIGRRLVSEHSYAYFNVGLGRVTGEKHGRMIDDETGYYSFGPTYEMQKVDAIGVPIEAGISRTWSRVVGLGINFHLNLNRDDPLVGVMVNISLGKIK